MNDWSALATPATVLLIAAASSLGASAVVLGRHLRSALPWSFGVGMVGFAVEAVAGFILLTGTESPDSRFFWLQAWQITGLLLLIPWVWFVTQFAHPEGFRPPLGWRLTVGAACLLLAAGAAALLAFPAFTILDMPGRFFAAQFVPLGRFAVVAQVLATVGILAGLEACLRTSKGATRWRIKYLTLGLGGIFLARFFFLSQMMLFQVVLAAYLPASAATLLVGNLVVGASLARSRFVEADWAVSRRVVYRSVVVGALGLYLFAVGGLGWLFNYLGIPEETFWGSILIFVSAIGLAVILLSENVRWRIKRFIAMNFYRSKYDYREQWITFTKRLGSLLSLEELAPQLLAAVTEAAGAAKGVLYLSDNRDGHYQLAGTAEIDRAPASVEASAPLIAALRTAERPVVLANTESGTGGEAMAQGLVALLGGAAVAVPLRWRDALIGVMLVGPERAGAPYTPEDMEFLMTAAEQAAGAIVTAQLSEAAAQTREFEAFNRLTSFVIHDLKNSVAALSLLSQNALAHFDDPEFQRDAIKTLSRTVDRIKALLGRLSAAPEAATLHFQPVDLSALALEVTRSMGGGGRVSLVKELAPVAPVPGDPEALLRVIQNLITNAVEAIEGEGTVTVQTFEEPRWAVCAVTDTGKGMSQEFLQKSLFTPFRSTKKGGWGIGLYQAKGIVEAHGGTIEVTSREGQGTTFRVKLPIEPRRGETPGS